MCAVIDLSICVLCTRQLILEDYGSHKQGTLTDESTAAAAFS